MANKQKKQFFFSDLINEEADKIKVLNKQSFDEAKARLDNLTKPIGSLGSLEDLAMQIAGITGTLNPDFTKKLIIVMAADHGVAEEGVSAYPKEVTPQMVYNFLSGGAGINVLARHAGADVVVVDIGIAADISKAARTIENTKSMLIEKKITYGTTNMIKGQAMSRTHACDSVEIGIEIAREMVAKGYGIIGTGDMGIANTTASSAIAAVVCGVDVEKVTGYGTGIDNKSFNNKVRIIKKAIKLNKPDPEDGIDILSKVGGFEIGGIAGVIIGCASLKVPVVIDGFISGAGALIAELIAPQSRNYMIASHSSVEKGHAIMLRKLKLKPLFNFNLRLGEGTGAAIGINIADAAIKLMNEMATFGEAGVTQKIS
jgi:nicotinate-nucleotide--dimethylbenzimidazole phosphoribosyltransferase